MKLESLLESTHFDHSRQVSRISAVLAVSAGYTPEETALIEQAALYHDVGKTDIPQQVLNKPGALTTEEFELVKTHTLLGYKKILDTINILSVAADVCRDHHERPDGTGYAGIAARDIHPYTRLISVADVFDALYSKRAYKEAWELPKIQSFFLSQSGTQFDAETVKLLLSVIGKVLQLYQTENV